MEKMRARDTARGKLNPRLFSIQQTRFPPPEERQKKGGPGWMTNVKNSEEGEIFFFLSISEFILQ
jgi:hypothetical protein